jgi:hypothetical protein
MSRQVMELETIVQQLIAEHRKLLAHVDAQQAAMKAMDLKAMDEAAKQQEAARLRIAGLEGKRRSAVGQLARAARIAEPLTLQKLAELYPARREALLSLRAELKDAIAQLSARTHVVGRLAGAVLGHLNTVVRLLAGAVEQAGTYTKNGIPRVAPRIGVMEAVG